MLYTSAVIAYHGITDPDRFHDGSEARPWNFKPAAFQAQPHTRAACHHALSCAVVLHHYRDFLYKRDWSDV